MGRRADPLAEADQMMMEHMIPQKRDMTEDEWYAVQDWLIKNGYADEDSF